MGQQYGREGGQRGGGHAWQRDDSGRRYREEAGALVYESQRDRDDATDGRYRIACGPDCCRSLLAHISAHIVDHVAAYMAYTAARGGDALDPEELRRWEVEAFGDRAYPAAHAVLRYYVRCAVYGVPHARRPVPRVQPGLSNEERKGRMLVALDAVAEGKAMPRGPGRRGWDARRQALRTQAQENETGEEGQR